MAALGVHLAGRVLFDVSAALFWLRVLHIFTVSKTLGAYMTIMTRMVCPCQCPPLPAIALSAPASRRLCRCMCVHICTSIYS